MSIPICGINGMWSERRMYDIGFMPGQKKPDSSFNTNQMINNFDKNGDRTFSADETGKLSNKMGIVSTDFNGDSLINPQNIISKLSKLQDSEELLMLPERKMYDMGFTSGQQKPDANEIANQMINNFDKDGDGSLNLDELGKLSEKMMPMRMMHGVGFMSGQQKPDANEIANQMINNRDKDGDGSLSADELGKLSRRLGIVETDFNEDGLIDREKLASKISEKLEKMEELPKMRGLRIYRSFNNSDLMPYPHSFNNSDLMPYSAIRSKETETEIGNESTSVISEPDNNSEPEMASVVSENQSISDLVKQLLSRLDLSNNNSDLMPYPHSFNNSDLMPYPRPFNNSYLMPYSAIRSKETETEIGNESTSVISEPDNNSEPEMASVVSENQSVSDLVKQLLSRLDLSNEKTESFLEVMKNYGINVTT